MFGHFRPKRVKQVLQRLEPAQDISGARIEIRGGSAYLRLAEVQQTAV
jgi:hypothetical protein